MPDPPRQLRCRTIFQVWKAEFSTPATCTRIKKLPRKVAMAHVKRL